MHDFKPEKGSPLYIQVYDWIKANIKGEHWKTGMQLPPEPTLSKDIGISRSTLRQALRLLIDEGYCYQQPGKGTFVQNSRSRYELTILTSFTEQMMERGKQPSSKVLDIKSNIVPDTYIQMKLGLNPNDRVINIYRLRYGDGIPMSLENVYINEKLVAGIEKEDLTDGSLYNLMEKKYNHPILNGSISIEPDEISSKEADLLQIKADTSILYMENISYTTNSRPLLLTFAKYPKDRYIFTVSMPRR